MKIGIEVEGHHQGGKTLFIRYDELLDAYSWLELNARVLGVQHLYVMDHHTVMSDVQYHRMHTALAEFGLVSVTVEVKAIPKDIPRYPNVLYMVCVEVDPVRLGFFGANTVEGDQVKFTHALHVACADISQFCLTTPDKFANDIEVKNA